MDMSSLTTVDGDQRSNDYEFPWKRFCMLSPAIMLFYITIVMFVTVYGQIRNATTLETKPQYTLCTSAFNYTNGGQFESNLNSVLDRLLWSKKQTGFNISVYGQRPNQIYGVLQCTADVTVNQCYICSQVATTTIRQICGNAVGGSIWYDECFLRYEKYSFIGYLSKN